MWPRNWRERLPATLAGDWDLVIIGGGITGAGILLEAARQGLRALLVEQRDFAWGTSSRSSKLVHGGLRYLKQGRLLLTRASVQEREKLLRDAAGLVTPQSFAFADYRGRKPGRWLFSLGLALYDWLGGQRSRRYYAADEFLLLAPHIARTGLKGGMCYGDAKTDDARLVLRVLQEALAAGGVAVNYLAATRVLRAEGKVSGVELLDALGGASHTIKVKVLINATGAWADGLRRNTNTMAGPKLRPLRGSHLLLPAWRLPLAQAVSLLHPRDGRPVFAFPWEGVSLVGTTDVDHRADMKDEAAITPDEVAYLMQALAFQFPELCLGLDDIVATFAGVRPVIDSGKTDPSKEARDHAVWLEQGLLTVTGGKLTTFRLIAQDALAHCVPLLPAARAHTEQSFRQPQPLTASTALTQAQVQRLQGRYGKHAAELLAAASGDELQTIAGSETLWAELRWAARAEAVVHLEDLLLRRTRLGLQLRGGGVQLLPRIRAVCQAELGWDDQRWLAEEAAYLELWRRHYSLPPRETIPDWRAGGATVPD